MMIDYEERKAAFLDQYERVRSNNYIAIPYRIHEMQKSGDQTTHSSILKIDQAVLATVQQDVWFDFGIMFLDFSKTLVFDEYHDSVHSVSCYSCRGAADQFQAIINVEGLFGEFPSFDFYGFTPCCGREICSLSVAKRCDKVVIRTKRGVSRKELVVCCEHCRKDEIKRRNFTRCRDCKAVYYCSKKFQVEDWTGGHKEVCSLFCERKHRKKNLRNN
jgi:hypothetical protein